MCHLQDALKAEHFLWQLFHIEKDIREALDEAKEQKEELNESAKALYAQEQQIEAKKKIVAGFQKERLLLERRLKKRKADADKKVWPFPTIAPRTQQREELTTCSCL